ncbi:MAG TPA: hypothetical protein VHB77_14010 [Planctomycetaceae bacterium]|nr:hypothetical protein [Planctomycetaceae bacterium]
MRTVELPDSASARRYLLSGLWLARVAPPTAERVHLFLDWAFEAAATTELLPPLGFIADAGALLLLAQPVADRRQAERSSGLPDRVVRAYEDYVLSRFLSDASLDRARHALRRYSGRDRLRAFAFVIDRLRERLGFGGAVLSPAVIQSLRQLSADEILQRAAAAAGDADTDRLLGKLYREIAAGGRRTRAFLTPEDLFELEQGTAIADFAQRLALRQALQATTALAALLPPVIACPRTAATQAPAAQRGEDAYPVGGFSSISNRGSIESLLHSELAYIEPDQDRPDLFDVKFLRNELLYYSRDENQFWRRRQTDVWVLTPRLQQLRTTEPGLAWQRIIVALALVRVVCLRRLQQLGADGLQFEIVVLQEGNQPPLVEETELLGRLLGDLIGSHLCRVEALDLAALQQRIESARRTSECRVIALHAEDLPELGADIGAIQVRLDTPSAELSDSEATPITRWAKLASQLQQGERGASAP